MAEDGFTNSDVELRYFAEGRVLNARHLVSVLLPVAVERPYTYASDRALAPGTIVVAPLGTRLVIGAVWSATPDEVAPKKLREIERIFDAPPLPEALIRFVDWVA